MTLQTGSLILRFGQTSGMFPGVWTRKDEMDFRNEVWGHEGVHAVQSLQLDALEPSFAFFTNESDWKPAMKKRLIRFEHLKVGLVNLGDSAVESMMDYRNRWREIEALRIAQNFGGSSGALRRHVGRRAPRKPAWPLPWRLWSVGFCGPGDISILDTPDPPRKRCQCVSPRSRTWPA